MTAAGDFLVSGWGYDQTNIDFYKVVEVTPSGKSVKVQAWTASRVGGEGQQDALVPGDEPATVVRWDGDEKIVEPAPIRLHRLRHGWITLTSYSSASPWDGRPAYATAPGFGH